MYCEYSTMNLKGDGAFLDFKLKKKKQSFCRCIYISVMENSETDEIGKMNSDFVVQPRKCGFKNQREAHMGCFLVNITATTPYQWNLTSEV